MKYSDPELRSLVGRATPLHLRRHGGIEFCAGESQAVVRLQQWRHALSVEGDVEILARRLAIDGLDAETCLPLLGSTRLADHEALPAWADRLNDLLHSCDSRDNFLQDDWVLPLTDWAENCLPFWEVWVPFVTGATDELRGRAGKSLDNLVEDALRSFQAQNAILCRFSNPQPRMARRHPVTFTTISLLTCAAAACGPFLRSMPCWPV
jgi:hypothetical protein